jgi:hypothetical protein
MREGDTETFEVYATDANGDTLGYAWALDGAPSGDDAPQFTWTAPAGSLGAHEVRVTVSDGHGATDSAVWAITVEPTDSDGGEDGDAVGILGISCTPGPALAAPLPLVLPCLLLLVSWARRNARRSGPRCR